MSLTLVEREEQIDGDSTAMRGISGMIGLARGTGKDTEPGSDLAILQDCKIRPLARICQHRGWWLASDDAKALRMASELGVRSTDTPGIVKNWADTGVELAEISAALLAIEARARFLPRQSRPLFAWWVSSLQRQ